MLILSSMFFGRWEGGRGGGVKEEGGWGGGGVLSGVGTYSLRLFDTSSAGCLETVDT